MRELTTLGINKLSPKYQPGPVFVSRVLLEHSHVACGSFHATMAGPRSYNGDCMVHKVQSIYYLTLSGKDCQPLG